MGNAAWATITSTITRRLSKLYREKATLESAEIQGRAQTLQMSSASSASAAEQEAKIVVADLRADIVRLNGDIAGLELQHRTVTGFMVMGVEYSVDIDPTM